MRTAVLVSSLLLLATGCATQVTPNQYLDEDTAATITVVASPWLFVADNPASAFVQRGYLNVHAFDVNRAGTHQHYFAVMQSSFDVALPDEKSWTPTLEFQAGDRKLVFQSTTQNPRQLGITRPLERPVALESRWWYFAATKQDIAAVAQMQSPRVLLVGNEAQFSYVEFRNGSKQLAELSAALP